MASRKQQFVMPVTGSSSIFKEDIFRGKVLFCTGGGSGICRGMTEAMMRHGANATIIGRKLDRLTQTAKELSQATGRTCLPIQGDVRIPTTLKDAVEKTLKEFGRIDFVICGAAGNFLAPIFSLSENAFKTVIDIDMIGTFNTIKATLPYIRESKGAYIHVSATLHYHAVPYQAHASAAKAGVDALSAVLAIEEGPNGVRSNVIAPGPIAGTEGMDRLSLKNSGTAPAPTGRMGDIRDIENAAVFLFSDAASYITGQVLPVDGGSWHLLLPLVPYPDALLNPEDYRDKIKPRM